MAEATKVKYLTKAGKVGFEKSIYEKGKPYKFTDAEWKKVPEKIQELFTDAPKTEKSSAGTLTADNLQDGKE